MNESHTRQIQGMVPNGGMATVIFEPLPLVLFVVVVLSASNEVGCEVGPEVGEKVGKTIASTVGSTVGENVGEKVGRFMATLNVCGD